MFSSDLSAPPCASDENLGASGDPIFKVSQLVKQIKDNKALDFLTEQFNKAYLLNPNCNFFDIQPPDMQLDAVFMDPKTYRNWIVKHPDIKMLLDECFTKLNLNKQDYFYKEAFSKYQKEKIETWTEEDRQSWYEAYAYMQLINTYWSLRGLHANTDARPYEDWRFFGGAVAQAPIQYVGLKQNPQHEGYTSVDVDMQAGTAAGGIAGLMIALLIRLMGRRYYPYEKEQDPLYRTFKTLASVGQSVGNVLGSFIKISLVRKVAISFFGALFSLAFGLIALPIVYFREREKIKKEKEAEIKAKEKEVREAKEAKEAHDIEANEAAIKKTHRRGIPEQPNQNIPPEFKNQVSISRVQSQNPIQSQKKPPKSIYQVGFEEGWSKYGKTGQIYGISLGMSIAGLCFLLGKHFAALNAAASVAVGGAIGGVAGFVLTVIAVPVVNKLFSNKWVVEDRKDKEKFRNNYIRAGLAMGASLGSVAGFLIGTLLFPGLGSMLGMTIGGAIGGLVGGIAIGKFGERISRWFHGDKESDNSWDYAVRTADYTFGLLGAAIGFFVPIPGGVVIGAALGTAIGKVVGAVVGMITVKLARKYHPDEHKAEHLPWTQRVANGTTIGMIIGAGIGALIGFFVGGPFGLIAGVIVGGSIAGFCGGVWGSRNDKTARKTWEHVLKCNTAEPLTLLDYKKSALQRSTPAKVKEALVNAAPTANAESKIEPPVARAPNDGNVVAADIRLPASDLNGKVDATGLATNSLFVAATPAPVAQPGLVLSPSPS